jgi:ribosome-associated translation inhibitor RaiA/cold shock CspA family protein
MQTEVQITFRDIPPSEAVEARIRDRVIKLEEFHPRITACKVVVGTARRGHHKGKVYQVRIDLTLPGEELVINREHRYNPAHEDVHVAVRDAFNALERQIKGQARRMRGQVKLHEVPTHGRIVRMFPDHGFITTPDGELYFHRNSVAEGGFEALDVGSEVRYVLATDDGEFGPQASTVHPVGKHHVGEPPGRP